MTTAAEVIRLDVERLDTTYLSRLLKGLTEPTVVLEARTALDPPLVTRLQETLSAVAGREVKVGLVVVPRLEVSARLILGRGKKIDLDLTRRMLEDLESQFAERKREGVTTVEETAEHLVRIIEKAEQHLHVEDVAERGDVLQVGDGIAIASGLRKVGAQEVIRFQRGVYGIAFNLLRDSVGCLLLGPEESIEVGSTVERTGRLLHIPAGKALVGRIVNALGLPIDGKGPIDSETIRPVERSAPGVVDRHPVIEPLHSGIKIIDALVPLGRGQRELILGDRKIGKTAIAIDTILSQRGTGVICIYAAIGQKASTVARVVRTLEERGAMEYTIVVAALSNEQPAFRYLVPYTACAMGEECMDTGGHALVIYDDLSKHAVTYREISALLKRPIGREAYPGDIFYIHSRLLERAARLRDDLGGGSLTALPIVETLAGDISAFIPTNVISICDGQIFLDGRLFNEGFRPAMDPGLSVSRIGGMAQTRAMKKVAGRLRIDLAQYHEMAQFVKFGAEVDRATLDQLTRGEREREILKQGQHAPLPLERQVAIFYAAVHGYLDTVPVDQVKTYEEELFGFLEGNCPGVLGSIREMSDLSEETEGLLAQALTRFSQDFIRHRMLTNPVAPIA